MHTLRPPENLELESDWEKSYLEMTEYFPQMTMPDQTQASEQGM